MASFTTIAYSGLRTTGTPNYRHQLALSGLTPSATVSKMSEIYFRI